MKANYYTLVLAHAVVFSLALLWFIPIAIFSAKFFRSRNKALSKNGQIWKYVHISMNIVATLLIIAGFTLGYYASGNSFQVGRGNAHFVSQSCFRQVIFSYCRLSGSRSSPASCYRQSLDLSWPSTFMSKSFRSDLHSIICTSPLATWSLSSEYRTSG